MSTTALTGARGLTQAMSQSGISHIFSLSGNHIMPVYDALRDSTISLVHTRHEAAAVHMADAWARLTGQTGVALVTGGPGHANAVSALYTACMSEAPVVLLSGHSPLSHAGYGAFQEMDQVGMARPVVKAAWKVTDPATLAHEFARACSIAQSGRPGPVHLSLPSDVLEAHVNQVEYPQDSDYQKKDMPLSEQAAQSVVSRLYSAKRPLIIMGPQGLTDSGRKMAKDLEALLNIPVLATESPRGLNDPSMGCFATIARQADCILLLGKRLDFTLSFGHSPFFDPECIFMQIDSDTEEFTRSQQAIGPRLAFIAQADVTCSVSSLQQAARQPSGHSLWLSQVHEAIHFRPPQWHHTPPADTGLHPTQLCHAIQQVLDSHPDAVLVVDGGEFGQWAQACLQAPHRLINGAAGAIGAALPMAVAAKMVYTDAPVVAVMGDGTFGFHCAEFDTAVRYHAPLLCVVGNDACWNAEHQIQIRTYGARRTFGCELLPSRYDLVAQAFGGYGEYIEQADTLPAALLRALASHQPACLNVALQGLPAPVIRKDD